MEAGEVKIDILKRWTKQSCDKIVAEIKSIPSWE